MDRENIPNTSEENDVSSVHPLEEMKDEFDPVAAQKNIDEYKKAHPDAEADVSRAYEMAIAGDEERTRAQSHREAAEKAETEEGAGIHRYEAERHDKQAERHEERAGEMYDLRKELNLDMQNATEEELWNAYNSLVEKDARVLTPEYSPYDSLFQEVKTRLTKDFGAK